MHRSAVGEWVSQQIISFEVRQQKEQRNLISGLTNLIFIF